MRKGSNFKISINSNLFANNKRVRNGRLNSQVPRKQHLNKEDSNIKEENEQLLKVSKQVSEDKTKKKHGAKTQELKHKTSAKQKSDNMSDGLIIVKKQNSKLQKIRDKRKGKTQEELEEQYIKEEENYRRRKPIIIISLTLVIIILLYLFFIYGPIFGISLEKSQEISMDRKIDIVTTAQDIYKTYDENLMVYSNHKIITYDRNGKKNWEYSLEETFNPKIYINGKYMVVSNNSTGKIYLFENKKEILNKKIEGVIRNINIDEYGNMAIEYSTSGYKTVIGVYSKVGKNLYNSYLSTTSIINTRLIEGGKKLLVVQSDESSSKIGIKINLIDGQKSQNNISEIAKLDNSFMYDLTIQDQNIIMLLDSKIIKINMTTSQISELKTFDKSQIMFLALSNNCYSYIEEVENEKDTNYKIETLMFDNETISTFDLSNLPKTMENTGLLNYLTYQDSLQVINKWGLEIKNINLTAVPKDIVVFNNEKSVGLVYTNKIYIVNM